MLSVDQARLLTDVEHDAPMARMMRARYWIPCARSESLVADGTPRRVTLMGRHYVAFRATDGRIGFFDEACPHRGVSLVLARNEECGLRCIFHGWKFEVSGKVAEIPSEGDRGEKLAASITLNHYPTIEGGGLIWAFLGQGDPPPRPPLPFMDLGPDNMWVSRSINPCNWLQGVEGTIDSIHVGTLHQSWIGTHNSKGANVELALVSHPRYEVEDAPYGLRAAALRQLPDGKQYIRVTEYIMPFVSLAPGAGRHAGTVFISVPIDNTSHMLFWGIWNEAGPRSRGEERMAVGLRDHDNFAMIAPGKDWTFGQDRDAMANGHFSGITQGLIEEDLVVLASQGATVNRQIEQLSGSDVGLVRARRRLLTELEAFERGEPVVKFAEQIVRPLDSVVEAGIPWREIA